MSNIVYTQAIPQRRSVAAAFWLAFFFGPLGTFYAGAMVGFLNLLVGLVALLAVPFTFGLSLLVPWITAMIWAPTAVSNANGRAAFMLNRMEEADAARRLEASAAEAQVIAEITARVRDEIADEDHQR